MEFDESLEYNHHISFLSGGGELAELIRIYPWEKTTLGPLHNWSQSLKNTVSIILRSPVPYIILWGDKGIMIYNDAYATFACAKHPFLLGANVHDGWPEAIDFNTAILESCLQGNKLSYKDQKFTLFRNNVSEEVWTDLFYTPIFNEGDTPAGILAIVIETTQRILAERKQKLAEEALWKREEHLRALITATSDLIYKMNANWTELEVLQGNVFVPNKGKPDPDWFENIIPLVDQNIVRNTINESIKLKALFQLEHRVRLADGSIGWTVSRAIPILNAEGEITEWLGAASDVTERKKAEEALKESEERFRAIADDAPVFIFLAGENAEVEYLNKTWRDYTGVSTDDSKGRAWAEITHPDDVEPATKIYMDGFNRRESCTFENRQKGTDGVYRTILWKATPRFSTDGQFIGLMGVGLDIHERKQLENELKDRNQELQRINNDLDNFIYTASHDLKAPIANLEGLLRSLKKLIDSRIGEQEIQLLHMIDLSIERFVSTIKDLTEISKLQVKSHEDLQKVYFNKIVEGIVTDINPLLTEKNALVKTDFEVDSVEFSRKDLNSILYNLISNAVKYSSPNRQPEILVKTNITDGTLALSVQDNGLGIDLRNKDKIFMMFKRLHNHIEGSGIGLYIVKKLVENNGGQIEVQSELGKGSTFILYFKL